MPPGTGLARAAPADGMNARFRRRGAADHVRRKASLGTPAGLTVMAGSLGAALARVRGCGGSWQAAIATAVHPSAAFTAERICSSVNGLLMMRAILGLRWAARPI